MRQSRHAFEKLGHEYEKLILLCLNKFVDVGRKQWNYYSNEYSFNDDIHFAFNRT
jgi:hypothetical protein